MDNTITQRLLRFGWKLPYLRLLSSRKTVILVYHGIPKEPHGSQLGSSEFEQHILFLKQHFELVPPQRFQKKRKAFGRPRVLLTFDDGFRNHADVVAPILRKHATPALFFISSRHSIRGKYLWFSYLRALQKHFPHDVLSFRGVSFDMSPAHREASIERLSNDLLDLKPHPGAMYLAIEKELPKLEEFVDENILVDSYAGMTAEQIAHMAKDPLFTFGAHTVDHPFLTRCGRDEINRQLLDNKTWIEALTRRQCLAIAYPGGAYDRTVLELCDKIGFTRGHALIPILNTDDSYEIPRLGIYSKSLDILGFKVQWGQMLRGVRIRIG